MPDISTERSVHDETPRLPRLPERHQSQDLSQARTEAYRCDDVVADRYRLVRELGRGGMGVVWRAHALMLDVDVAIKFVTPVGSREVSAARMEREAHAAARCSHSALVGVFDFGRTEHGDPFLVMELVEGETLSAIIQRVRRLTAIDAVRLLIPVVDGLRAAHRMGVIHRDVKPANVQIVRDHRGARWPKLLDFGIAKLPAGIQLGITADGTVLGSPEYMSPEQALGRADVDARTDVWSLCATLYHLVTGSPPYLRSTYNALLQAILHEPVAPTTELGCTDAALWEILKRGLVKDHTQRIASMTELGSALSQWLLAQGVSEDSTRKSLVADWNGPAETSESVPSPLPATVWATNVMHDASSSKSRTTTPARARRAMPLVNAHGLVIALLVSVGAVAFWGSHAARFPKVASNRPSIPIEGRASPERNQSLTFVARADETSERLGMPTMSASAVPASAAPASAAPASAASAPRRRSPMPSRYHDFGF